MAKLKEKIRIKEHIGKIKDDLIVDKLKII